MRTTTRDRLINTAGDLFYERGFQAVGLDQILARVGITKTAFYKHFESKDDLILAVIDQRDRADVAITLDFMRARGGDPRAQLLALFDLLGEWFGQPSFRGCLFMNAATEFPDANDPIHRAAKAHSDHLAAEVLLRVQALGAGDPMSVTRQIMLLVSGAIASRHVGGVADAATVARLAVESLLSAAVPVQAPRLTKITPRRREAPRLRVRRRRSSA